jgi:6-pyruvoyltetrahydropterin/6-carboxytetrahydropterin synthase
MHELTIVKSFSAAHVLAEIGGKCEELHGHNFKVELTVAGPKLNPAGLLIDFRIVKKWLAEILEDIDHKYLNDHPSFAGINPSAENIAGYISEKMEAAVEKASVKVVKVKVWESDNAAVTYIPDKN